MSTSLILPKFLTHPNQPTMNPIDIETLERLAKEAIVDGNYDIQGCFAFYATLSPSVVLALIERLEKAEKDTARINKQQEHGLRFARNECGWYCVRRYTGRMEDFFPDLRSAIDSANPSPEASQP